MNTADYSFLQIMQPYLDKYKLYLSEASYRTSYAVNVMVGTQFEDKLGHGMRDRDFTIILNIDASEFYIGSYYGLEFSLALGSWYIKPMPIDNLSLVLDKIITYFEVSLRTSEAL